MKEQRSYLKALKEREERRERFWNRVALLLVAALCGLLFCAFIVEVVYVY